MHRGEDTVVIENKSICTVERRSKYSVFFNNGDLHCRKTSKYSVFSNNKNLYCRKNEENTVLSLKRVICTVKKEGKIQCFFL